MLDVAKTACSVTLDWDRLKKWYQQADPRLFVEWAITMKSYIKILLPIVFLIPGAAQAQSIGRYSANPYAPNSTSNPYGAGSPYNPNSINNPYGKYGSGYSNDSASNPYATDAPKLYDQSGRYHGKLSTNPYDPDSVSNPYGRYGSRYSADSINNPYGAGSPYAPSSPTNPYGQGMNLYGSDGGGED